MPPIPGPCPARGSTTMIGGFSGIDRHVRRRDDAHERVIDRPLQLAAVEHDFGLEGQNMRRRPWPTARERCCPARSSVSMKQDAALRRVPPIFRGRVEHGGILRHYISSLANTRLAGQLLGQCTFREPARSHF